MLVRLRCWHRFLECKCDTTENLETQRRSTIRLLINKLPLTVRMLFLLGSRKWEPLLTSVPSSAPSAVRKNDLTLGTLAAHLSVSEPRPVGFLAVDNGIQDKKRMPGAAALVFYSDEVT